MNTKNGILSRNSLVHTLTQTIVKMVKCLTDIIEFSELKKSHYKEILDFLLKERIDEFTSSQQVKLYLEAEDSVKEFILKQYIDAKMGVRALERSVEMLLIEPFADMLNKNPDNSYSFKASIEDNKIIFLQTNESTKDCIVDVYDDTEEKQ